MSEIKVDTVAEKTSANGVTVDGLSIKDSKLVTANSVITSNITNSNITYAKIQNVTATNRILGRDSANAGVIEEITPANLRTMLNVADGATVGGGKVLQVKQFTFATQQTTTSASFVGTSLQVAITPSSSSNKILVQASTPMHGNANGWDFWATLYRGSTNLGSSAGMAVVFGNATAGANASMIFLDSPSTTSATTYRVYHRTNSGNGTNHVQFSGGTGVITVSEIEA